MDMKCCQSCGMPMGDTDEKYGLEKDGTKSKDYCSFCYENGEFKQELTLEQMKDVLVPFMLEYNSAMKEEDARAMLGKVLPNLKRWQ